MGWSRMLKVLVTPIAALTMVISLATPVMADVAVVAPGPTLGTVDSSLATLTTTAQLAQTTTNLAVTAPSASAVPELSSGLSLAPMPMSTAVPTRGPIELPPFEVPSSPFNFSDARTLFGPASLPPEPVNRDGTSFADEEYSPTRENTIQSVVAGDFNGDGYDDIAYTVFNTSGYNSLTGSRYVVVQLSDGFGGFSNPMAYLLGDATTMTTGQLNKLFSMTIADVDNDGNLDLIVVGTVSKSIQVLLGNGEGAFPTMTETPVAVDPTGNVAAADINGDGVIDLVFPAYRDSAVVVFAGNGDGTFRPEAKLDVAWPTNAQFIDTDGAGNLAIITTSATTSVGTELWRHTECSSDCEVEGPNGWAVDATVSIPATKHVWVGDFNDDGRQDFAVYLTGADCDLPGSSSNNTCVRPYKNNGDGTFTEQDSSRAPKLPTASVFYMSSSMPQHFTGQVFDVDRDGNLDVLVPGVDGEVGVLYGDGGFGFDWMTVTGTSRWEPDTPDGWDCTADCGRYPNGLDYPRKVTLTDVATGIVAGNFNGQTDGTLDLVVATSRSGDSNSGARSTNGHVTYVQAIGDDRQHVGSTATFFPSLPGQSVPLNTYQSDGYRLADWDGDGYDDIIMIAGNKLTIAYGGAEGFDPDVVEAGDLSRAPNMNLAFCNSGRFFGVGDLNKDGRPDIACHQYKDNLTSTQLYVLYQQEDGTVKPQALDYMSPRSDQPVYALEILDMDGDGANDIVYATAGESGAEKPGSALAFGWTQNLGPDPENDGQQKFAESQLIPTAMFNSGNYDLLNSATQTPRPVIADLNGDGHIDIAFTARVEDENGVKTDQLIVLLRDVGAEGEGAFDDDGAPVFTKHLHTMTYNGNSYLSAGDFNNDGHLDLVATHIIGSNYGVNDYNRHGEIEVFLNNGAGVFTSTQVFAANMDQPVHKFADLNGDGHVDMISTSNGRGVVLRAGNGDGTFGPLQSFRVPAVRLGWVEPVDLNDDGLLDIVGVVPDNSQYFIHGLVTMHNLGGSAPGYGGGPVVDPNAEVNLGDVTISWAPADGEPDGSANAPLTGVTHGSVEVTVTNTGDGIVSGDWVDTVWLSNDDEYAVGDTLLATVPRSDPLLPGEKYTFTAEVTVTPRQTGEQHLVVRTDTRNQIPETHEDDNAASHELKVQLPEIGLPTGATLATTTVTPTGDARPALLLLPEITEPMVLTVQRGSATTRNVVTSVRDGSVPTVTVAEHRLTNDDGVTLEAGPARYVSVAMGGGFDQPVSIQLQQAVGVISSFTPRTVVGGGPVTVSFTGFGLGAADRVALIADGGTEYSTTKLRYFEPASSDSPGTLTATFDASTWPQMSGTLQVRLASDDTIDAAQKLTVGPPAPGSPRVSTDLFTPLEARAGYGYAAMITFSNTARRDAVAPLYRLRSAGVEEAADAPFQLGDVLISPSVPGYPAGVIPSGYAGRITIPFNQLGAANNNHLPDGTDIPDRALFAFDLDVMSTNSIAPFSAGRSLAASMNAVLPADMPDDERDLVADLLDERFGGTGGGYITAVQETRPVIPDVGGLVDIAAINNLLVAEAADQLPGVALSGLVPAAWAGSAAVTVRSSADGGATVDETVPVGDSGYWAVRDVPAGTVVDVYLSGFGPGPVASATTPRTGLDISARPVGWQRVSGTVKDASGDPIGLSPDLDPSDPNFDMTTVDPADLGATVTIRDTDTGETVTAVTNAAGIYVMRGVAPGTYEFTVTLASGAQTVDTVTVDAYPVVKDVMFPDKASVTGRVVDDASDPVPGAHVRILTVETDPEAEPVVLAAAVTESDGTFELIGLEAAAVTVQVQAAGFAQHADDITLSVGDNDLGEIQLSVGATVTGVVKDSDGAGVADATVATAAGGAATTTDASGNYTLRGVAQGSVSITASHADLLAAQERVDTSSGSATADFTLRLGGSLTVSVVDDTGQPVADVPVRLTVGTDDTLLISRVTDTGGVAEFTDLESGAYQLAAHGSGVAGTTVTIASGANIARTLTVQPAAVTGTLPDIHDVEFDEEGTAAEVMRPAANVTVWAHSGGLWQSTRSDADGTFTLTGVAGQTVELWVYDDYLGVLHRQETFPAAGEMELGAWVRTGHTLTISLPWMDVEAMPLLRLGQVGDDGPLDEVLLIPDLEQVDAANRVVEVFDQSGSDAPHYTVKNLPPGEYALMVYREAGDSGEKYLQDTLVEFSMPTTDTTVTVGDDDFDPFLRVTGTASTSDGAPLAEIGIQLEGVAGDVAGRTYYTETDSDGKWEAWVPEPDNSGAFQISGLDWENSEHYPALGYFPEGYSPPAPFAPGGPGRSVGLSGGAAHQAVAPHVGVSRPMVGWDDIFPSEKNYNCGMFCQIVTDMTNEVLGMNIPGWKQIRDGILDSYDIKPIQESPAVAAIRGIPFPEDTQCVTYRNSGLVKWLRAQRAADNAREIMRQADDAIKNAERDLNLHAPELALETVAIVNDFRAAIVKLPALDLASGGLESGKANRFYQAASGGDFVADYAGTVGETFGDLIGGNMFEEIYGVVDDVTNLYTNLMDKYQEGITVDSIWDAVGIADNLLDAIDAAVGLLGNLPRFAASDGKGAGIFGQLMSLKNAVKGIYEAIGEYQKTINLLKAIEHDIDFARSEYAKVANEAYAALKDMQAHGFPYDKNPDCEDENDGGDEECPAPPPPPPLPEEDLIDRCEVVYSSGASECDPDNQDNDLDDFNDAAPAGSPPCPAPDPDPDPDGSRTQRWTLWPAPRDPNEIVGHRAGVGDERWMNAADTLGYTIYFENLGPGTVQPPEGFALADAPASVVQVDLPLDAGIDLASVALGEFGFGVGDDRQVFSPPPGAQAFEDSRGFTVTVPSLYEPGKTDNLTLSLVAKAWLETDGETPTVRWDIRLVDPTTGLPHANPQAGFLPPEPTPNADESNVGAGQGFINVFMRPTSDIATGDTVSARAEIIFDENDDEMLPTNTWVNTFDATAPHATVTGSSATRIGETVTIGGTDEGAGVASVDVWRSVNGEVPTLWKHAVTPGTVVLSGQVGDVIRLTARATDKVRNQQDVPDLDNMTGWFTTTLAPASTGGSGGPGGPGSPGDGAVPGDEADPSDGLPQADPCVTKPFGDVGVASSFCGEIAWFKAQNITGGYADGKFHAGRAVSRGAMAAFLYRLAHDGADAPACTTAPFPDVKVSAAFCGEIAWFKAQNITDGYSDGKFHAGRAVSRGAMAAFLYRLENPDAKARACIAAPFKDVTPGASFCSEIAWLADQSITTGYKDNTYRSTTQVSRGAMAAFLYRLTAG